VISQESVIGIAINIDADTYHRYSPGLHPFAHTDQGRNFFHAGCAPGRPKIEHDNLPMQLAQGDAAVGVLHCEIRRAGADPRRTRAAITANQQKKNKNWDRGKKPSHPDIITNSAWGETRNCAA